MQQITKTQIQECLNTYVKNYIVDANWHISLVEDFMHLLTGEIFNIDNLQDSKWIKTILDNNKDNEYTKKILMQKTPEKYISGIFDVIIIEITHE